MNEQKDYRQNEALPTCPICNLHAIVLHYDTIGIHYVHTEQYRAGTWWFGEHCISESEIDETPHSYVPDGNAYIEI